MDISILDDEIEFHIFIESRYCFAIIQTQQHLKAIECNNSKPFIQTPKKRKRKIQNINEKIILR